MAINLEKWNIQEDLTSQNFNRRLLELETHMSNIVSRLESENQQLRQQLNNKVDLITTKSFNLQTDDIYKIPAGSYLFSGDSRNNTNFPFQEQWCAGILIKYSSQTFGTNGENGTQTIIVMSHGKPIYYNVKAWESWAGWKYSVPNS